MINEVLLCVLMFLKKRFLFLPGNFCLVMESLENQKSTLRYIRHILRFQVFHLLLLTDVPMFVMCVIIAIKYWSFYYLYNCSSTVEYRELNQVICLSGLIISNPFHIFEIKFIIGTLLNNQLVPDDPDP